MIAGAGVGATFPLASSLHVETSRRSADPELGQVFATAAVGQILGPLLAGAIAHATGLRLGLLILPALVILGLSTLARVTARSPTTNEPKHTL